jgi:hypothetical protein
LTFQDYLDYQLYRHELSQAAREDFLSESIFWPLTLSVVDQAWQAATEDKWLMYSLLEFHQIPCLETLAIVAADDRDYGSYHLVSDCEGLSRYLQSRADYPLFFKPVVGLQSRGAAYVTGCRNGVVSCRGRDDLPVEEFWAALQKNGACLMQKVAQNHPDLMPVSSGLSTVRLYNLIDEDGHRVPFSLLKIAASGSIADNFWRRGNMLADLDEDTGALKRVISGRGVDLVVHENHPVSGDSFEGMTVPQWKEVVELNAKCARMFAPLKFSSTDIAVTPEGPKAVEVNVGGSFILPQLASGHGFLTDDVRRFFNKHSKLYR